MKAWTKLATLVLSFAVAAGCAKTQTTKQTAPTTDKLARPDQIVIYDFAATASDLPSDAAIAGQVEQTSQTPEQVAAGRKLGALVAKELAADIVAMGLPAKAAASGATPRIGDLVIKGYFMSIDEGSRAKRIAIGFGVGGAELQTAVEGYEMTDVGLRKLGTGTVESSAGKAPGAAVPAAVAIASGNPIGLVVSSAVKVQGEMSGRTTIEGRAKQTADEIAAQLKLRFQRHGWIN